MGSSSSRSFGSVARARASATRWASPPESRLGLDWALSPSSIRCSHSVASRSASAFDLPRLWGPKATLAKTVRWGKSRYSWNTMAHGRRSGGMSTFEAGSSRTRPSRTMRPVDSGWSPARDRRSVDFPLPLGPSTATTSPSPTSRSRHSSNVPTMIPTSATRLTI